MFITIILMQPVKKLVSGVRISQFDFSISRGGVPHSKMPVWVPHAVKLYLSHTEHGHLFAVSPCLLVFTRTRCRALARRSATRMASPIFPGPL
jgi:hypothetical protein